ncbi:uncharacterized protein BT62DRAFT_932030 [Guyanagaster necrorhizus]|uniref:Uncharacterized protein n=1 Tax=Guyanagaster necrorhizus TaxID=856835 RepID=A0A9P7VVE4_9AGAR|nr:uncharacterized protein BT62DRAFT_932030 [Guyanagaster necrorhizus MCA 3950]KAG7446591.1 hypothetical protein BT62DRAFT_932030 [Guyanagaster necrorhizus MCA 3950]
MDATLEPAPIDDTAESTSKFQYTLPDFPHNFSSGSSKLDVFGSYTRSSTHTSPIREGGTSSNCGGTTFRNATPDTTLISLANSSSTRDDADTTLVEDTNNSTANIKLSTTPSPKKLLLPVLKKASRRLSVTLFPTKPQSPARPSSPSSLCKPTISSMQKTVSPVSKPIPRPMKPTFPLRIKKKVNRAGAAPPVPELPKDGRLRKSVKWLSRMMTGS